MKTPPYVPLSDRWWIAQAQSIRDADDMPGHLRRMWATLPSSERPKVQSRLRAAYPGAIEIDFSAGRWDLIPQVDGSTELIYRIVTDPGGAVPRALSSRFAGRSVAENLESMLKAAGPSSIIGLRSTNSASSPSSFDCSIWCARRRADRTRLVLSRSHAKLG